MIKQQGDQIQHLPSTHCSLTLGTQKSQTKTGALKQDFDLSEPQESSYYLDEIDTDRLSAGAMIQVEYERYAYFLESTDASEEDKREFAQLLWNIMFSIASLRFGIHPLQVARKICGKTEFSAAAAGKDSR